ncbi:sterol desaturase family protein [Pontibacter sp. Tf4]|uniref:sterol desaturase family protein n=1 Tax=Pontibacter sp. Tf4 TaxID=2761620 RepID=UPI001628FCF4|nr:sterol desaturase family protein [Pontibacter sp. Tf4]MBB6610750.1 sterol desaturase family protein [Pontibacter sp. Tf4]
MEKVIYSLDQLDTLRNLTIMHYMAPVIVVLVVAEGLISYFKDKQYYDTRDTLAALAIGAGNAVLGAGLKIALFWVALVIYNQVPWAIPRAWWAFVICFIAVDFCRYWAHRIAHEQRFWWATHVTHHSSRKMNFLISLRTGWTNPIKFVFFVPVPLLGIDPFTFFICHQVAVLYQFFVHTELVRKMPAFIEYIFVTPSHHRVHHGSNAAYIDRNYGSTFIIWDRLFNTFQPETEKPVYGLTTPVRSYNPVYLVFHEWVDLFRDLRHCSTVKEGWRVLFSAPGTIVTDHQKARKPDKNDQAIVGGTVKEKVV